MGTLCTGSIQKIWASSAFIQHEILEKEKEQTNMTNSLSLRPKLGKEKLARFGEFDCYLWLMWKIVVWKVLVIVICTQVIVCARANEKCYFPFYWLDIWIQIFISTLGNTFFYEIQSTLEWKDILTTKSTPSEH